MLLTVVLFLFIDFCYCPCTCMNNWNAFVLDEYINLGLFSLNQHNWFSFWLCDFILLIEAISSMRSIGQRCQKENQFAKIKLLDGVTVIYKCFEWIWKFCSNLSAPSIPIPCIASLAFGMLSWHAMKWNIEGIFIPFS